MTRYIAIEKPSECFYRSPMILDGQVKFFCENPLRTKQECLSEKDFPTTCPLLKRR